MLISWGVWRLVYVLVFCGVKEGLVGYKGCSLYLGTDFINLLRFSLLNHLVEFNRGIFPGTIFESNKGFSTWYNIKVYGAMAT